MAERQISPVEEAQVIMQLYDLRREPEMRKARKFVFEQFWPATFEEFAHMASAMGTQENAWLRQVGSYWEMAASFVESGAISPQMFYDNCPEMWALYAKFKPFVPQTREMWNKDFMAKIERVAEATPEGRERIANMQARMKALVEARKQAAK